jgi:opacity protein-like surface antigen
MGTISGTVRDSQAAAVADATVSLVSEARGTKLPVVTSAVSGDFAIPNVPPDTYTLEIALKGFKTLKRTGIAVSAGDRVGLGPLTIEVGAITEAVTVTAEAALLQTQSAERSATITRTELQNVPLATRTFSSLISVIPGVGGTAQQPTRVGDSTSYSGGNANIMMDGVSTMDSGNNALAISVNTESVAEVKVLVSNYQAEYGRNSGVQISAVTKSGTNQFHGSAFLIMRRSKWNATNKANLLNGTAKALTREKDLGFTIGGPVGKPGRENKLFFFYSQEFDPRSISITGGNISGSTVYYRFPTALERAGDFSQTIDNNGNLYPYIKDPLSTSPCSSSNTAGCFKDGGVVGKIPSDRLYSLGQKILSLYPVPNLTAPGPYNYSATLQAQNIMSQEPVFKVDYQPWTKLRVSGKLTLWEQPATLQSGTLPGFNDTQVYKKWFYMWASTITYSINPTTAAEFTFGRTRNDLAGCFGPTNGVAPGLCTSSIPMAKVASLAGAGLTGLPQLFPNSGLLNKEYYAYQAMETLKSPIWDGSKMSLVPQFSWGNRINSTYAPPNFPFPGWLNTNQNNDMAFSVTKIKGSHTLKAGLYYTHSFKAQQSLAGTWQGSVSFANDTNNSLDSSYGYANAALGVFTSYSQLSKYVEGNYVYANIEGFIQDNWRVNSRLTLDYGVRFVHQPPQHDKLGQGVNWLPDKWSLTNAPLYYLAGCVGATPCSGSNRQAKDPRTGALLGANTAVAIGTLVPGTGNTLNGLFPSGTDPVPSGTYYWPALVPAPRFGIAYDITGKQKMIFRGGFGLTFDRPSGNTVFSLIANPPNELNQTLYYSQFQTMGGLATSGAPNLNVYQLHSDLPSTWTWSGGLQYTLPQNMMLDVSYTGLHGFNIVEQTNINTVDMGAAFLAGNQDPTVTSALPGGAAVTQNMMRSVRGYGSINMMLPRGWITSHTLQLALIRRMSHGLQFQVNDTVMLRRNADSGGRIQHDANGNWSYRSDQAEADELLAHYIPTRHTFKGDLVWSIPALYNAGSGAPKQIVKAVTRDWQLSGLWSASTGAAYTVGPSFQNGAGNQNITGSPDYGGRVRVVGDPGSGCSGDIYKQFTTSAFAPPAVGSVGLESGVDYLRGCFQQQFDLALQRDFRFGETRRLSFRLDAFNAFNQSHITGRNTTYQVTSTTDSTIVNLPFDSNGNLLSSRIKPNTSGFGQANAWQSARTLQAWLRFTF